MRLENNNRSQFPFDGVGQMGQRSDVQQFLVDRFQIVWGAFVASANKTHDNNDRLPAPRIGFITFRKRAEYEV